MSSSSSRAARPILRVRVACAGALLAGLTGCEAPAPPDDIMPVASMREVMSDMIAPAADVLWSAITTVETPDGYADRGPQTEEEWARLRHAATTMAESANLLLMERPVAPAGSGSTVPDVQLEPDSIAALIVVEHDRWVSLSQELRASAQLFLDAIDARDDTPLFDLGDALNTACEGCHQLFWYPPS